MIASWRAAALPAAQPAPPRPPGVARRHRRSLVARAEAVEPWAKSLAYLPAALSADPATHLLQSLTGLETISAACLAAEVQRVTAAGLSLAAAAGGLAGDEAAPPPLLWQAIDKALWFTRLACRAEHGFNAAEQQELAAATLQQLDHCLALGEVRCSW